MYINRLQNTLRLIWIIIRFHNKSIIRHRIIYYISFMSFALPFMLAAIIAWDKLFVCVSYDIFTTKKLLFNNEKKKKKWKWNFQYCACCCMDRIYTTLHVHCHGSQKHPIATQEHSRTSVMPNIYSFGTDMPHKQEIAHGKRNVPISLLKWTIILT